MVGPFPLLLFFAVHSAVLAVAPAASPAVPDLPRLYRQHAKAVVLVRATYKADGETTTMSSTGLVLRGGRILAQCSEVRHGLDNKTDVDDIQIVLGDFDAASGTVRPSRTMPAKVIRCDLERNLALLSVAETLPAAGAFQLADTPARPGQAVVALGHSWRGLPWTIHRCTVAGVGTPNRDATSLLSAVSPERREKMREGLEGRTMLETDCGTHPLYGSPALDAEGNVVGLLQVSHYDGAESHPVGYYFYLAASEIRAFLAE